MSEIKPDDNRSTKSDVFLYSGQINRSEVLEFLQLIDEKRNCTGCLLILVTDGGDPDAAFKIGRYIQRRYASFSVLVSGLCKSAGTLLAIGAEQLIFMPYGELGPLDVQLKRQDKIVGMESGLNIGEAFSVLQLRASEAYHSMILDHILVSGGVISYQTACHAASEMVSAMFGPIFGKFDPEEVGSRGRAMRIGENYGDRLNQRWNNIKEDALEKLSRGYPSHAFVIDFEEARLLFKNVRDVNKEERAIVEKLGDDARHESRSLNIQYLGTLEVFFGSEDTDERSSQVQDSEEREGSISKEATRSSGTRKKS